MRIALFYPPPWKMLPPGELQEGLRDGPPQDYGESNIDDGDFLQVPYGLLSLAAQAIRAGHDVLTLNLSNFPWSDIELLIRHTRADLFGLTCHASNQRGVGKLAQLIREVNPQAYIVCGGPFPTALPRETLNYYRGIDAVVMGEGEETFMELIHRLEAGGSTAGLAGTAWRSGDSVLIGPPRQRINNLDLLASPLDYFPTKVLVTSRGCPGECTFCGSKAMWGKQLTFHSAEYVIDMLQKAVCQNGQQYIMFKDETFTSHRARALDICQGIIKRNLNFIWSCDTRVDKLDEELLYFMRLAGCQRLSLGVESASPVILKNVKKHITPELVLEITRLAKKYGFQVRYYIMAGNRGETLETFRETLDFIEKAQPHQIISSKLIIYPGTEEFNIMQGNGATPEIFFKENYFYLKKFAGRPQDEKPVFGLMKENATLHNTLYYNVDELRSILEIFPNHPAVQLDLAGAYVREGQYDKAEEHVRRALELGYPFPGLALNYLACIAAAKRDFSGVMAYLFKAQENYPHDVVIKNMQSFHTWINAGGMEKGMPLNLIAHNLFEMNFIFQQPEKPGPIILRVGEEGKEYRLGPEDSLTEPLHVQC